jgi:acetolactate synthase-1/2/3 large subunit
MFNRLVHHNVKYVFGYPGGAILPVLNEFYNQNKIKYILSRTESGGSFMAEGYAKATRKPGVVMVTSGPGAINIMTSLQNALMDGTPILGLSGQVSTKVLGTDAFQEADIIGISKPCTKWNSMITNTEDINDTIDYAFEQIYKERYGPVLLDLPKNVMSSDLVFNVSKFKKSFPVKKIYIESQEITPQFINKLIYQSERPIILAGQGIFQSDAVKELRKVCEMYDIPITTTLLGL